jgi:Ca-activated chloride channel family protein
MTRHLARFLAASLLLGTTTVLVASLACSPRTAYLRYASLQEGPPLLAPSSVENPRAGTESYDRIDDNPFLSARDNPVSTFSIDVDTASYANVRRFLDGDHLPPLDAVRIEELVNYFHYSDPAPAGTDPLAARTEVGPCPWAPDHRLLRIGLRARNLPPGEPPPPRSLVFLIDVSGSMDQWNKLPLVKRALGLLAEQLSARDRIALVVYAGAAGVVLPPTAGSDQPALLSALDRLEAGGSTNGAEGIELAYALAERSFIAGGVNRVILATDGDFNVGVSSPGDLTRLIEAKRDRGVFLTVLGFGMGNLKDSTMEKLADRGNGNYAYIDSFAEARKVLVEDVAGTLITVAKDVKVQVEMNPAEVRSYRLLGYENRMLRREQFDDDRADAGELGAGQTVTALYEIEPARGVAGAAAPLRYQAAATLAPAAAEGELGTLKVRYKAPDGGESRLATWPVRDAQLALTATSNDFRFAAAVAAFGLALRASPHRGSATAAMARELAASALGARDGGDAHKQEFLTLAAKAQTLARGND